MKMTLQQEEVANLNGAKRIMLVEDEPLIALGVTGALELFGYDVCAAVQTGEEAVEQALRLRPDIILMDINLKGAMDGIEAAQRIGAESSIPVIFLTAQRSEVTRQRVKSTEHCGYLMKPFDLDKLSSTIEQTLKAA